MKNPFKKKSKFVLEVFETNFPPNAPVSVLWIVVYLLKEEEKNNLLFSHFMLSWKYNKTFKR